MRDNVEVAMNKNLLAAVVARSEELHQQIHNPKPKTSKLCDPIEAAKKRERTKDLDLVRKSVETKWHLYDAATADRVELLRTMGIL